MSEERKPSVLVVDDDPSVRQGLAALLRGAGYEASEADSGEACLEACLERPHDLVVLDVKLPGLSGREVCRALKASPRYGNPLVMHISAVFTSWTHAAQALEEDADDYLTHPLEPRTFLARVKALLRLRYAEDTLYAELGKRAELEAIVNRSPVVAVVWRAQPGWPVAYVSENIRQFGYEAREFMEEGLPFQVLVHPEDLGRVTAELEALRAADKEEYSQHYRILTRQGEVRFIEDRTVVRRDADGVVRFHEGLLQDVTERLRLEEERLDAETRARTLQTLWRLTQGLAHEIRNPLFAIQVNVAALEKSLSEGLEEQRALRFIKEHVSRLASLMRDVMELGHVPSPDEFVEVDLGQAIREAVGQLDSVHPGTPSRVSLPREFPSVRGIPNRLVMAFYHLLKNAEEARPGGEIRVSFSKEAERIRVRVEDEGEGIPHHLKATLFEPFVTSKTGQRGLGLTLARHYVELHGGTIEGADRDPPPGSVFTVTLPVHRRAG
ncbi:MAG: ATP-binding protein [Acidobacteriota bacterium]